MKYPIYNGWVHKKKRPAIGKYDWCMVTEELSPITRTPRFILKDRRWELLIYDGQLPTDEDPGIFRYINDFSPKDPLMALYKKGKLTGQALKDAELLSSLQ